MKKITIIMAFLVAGKPLLFAQTNGAINLSEGQKYTVENVITTTTSTEMMGQSMESKADVTSNYSLEVKGTSGDNINFLNTITLMKMSVNAMGQDMNFDSDKKEDMEGDMGKNFKDIINQPKDVVMSKTGTVILKASVDTSSDTASGSNPTEMMMKQLGGDPASQGYGAKIAFEIIPKGAKEGTTWSDSSDQNGTKRVTRYTLKSISGNDYTIALDGTIDSQVKTEMQGMEIQTKTTGKFSGEEIVDAKTGVIKTNTTNSDATGTVQVMGQEIPTSSKIKSVTTVKPI